MALEFFRDSELGAPASWVTFDLFGRRDNHFVVNQAVRTGLAAVYRIFLYLAVNVSGLHNVLHHAVLEGVVGDDAQSSAFGKQLRG